MKTFTKLKERKGKVPTRLYNDDRIRPKSNPVFFDAARASVGDKEVMLYREGIRIYCGNNMKH